MEKILKDAIIEISKPVAGWSTFSIKDEEKEFSGSLSYVDDVPNLLLDLVENKIKTGKEQVATFDEEGTTFTIVLQDYGVYIISDKENITAQFFLTSAKTFAKDVCDELMKNIDAWAEFDIFAETEEEYEKEKNENKKNLTKRIAEISKTLN